jgi:hypothetical protein
MLVAVNPLDVHWFFIDKEFPACHPEGSETGAAGNAFDVPAIPEEVRHKNVEIRRLVGPDRRVPDFNPCGDTV